MKNHKDNKAGYMKLCFGNKHGKEPLAENLSAPCSKTSLCLLYISIYKHIYNNMPLSWPLMIHFY